MIVQSLINRSFQNLSRLSYRSGYSIVQKSTNSKFKTFSQKVEQLQDNKKDDIKNIKRNIQTQTSSTLFQSNKQLKNQKTKQKSSNNPFSQLGLDNNSINQMDRESLDNFKSCFQNLQEGKYEESAKDLQQILDSLEEQKAHSDVLTILELQNSLYLYSRKYLDAFIVRSNISKFMEYAPNNYEQHEIQEQAIKLYYQLIFTHSLQAEYDLETLYKNHYKNFTSENKALFDMALAVINLI